MAATKLKARFKKDVVTVKALMNHPMETGLRKIKETGKLVPAHHITEITCTAGGKSVFSANWSGGVSKNPYLAFKYAGAKGDEIALTWKDNKGATETVSSKVK
jgi:sulfur-oxidizing protein SoxZ